MFCIEKEDQAKKGTKTPSFSLSSPFKKEIKEALLARWILAAGRSVFAKLDTPQSEILI